MKKLMTVAMVGVLTVLVGCSSSGGKKKIDQDGTLDVSTQEQVGGEDQVAVEDVPPVEEVKPGDVPPVEEVKPEDVPPVEEVKPEDVPPVEEVAGVDVYIPDLSKEGDDCYTVVLCGLSKGCQDPTDEECWGPCYADASQMALWDLALVTECYVEKCSELAPDQEPGSCLWEMCGLALYVCVGGEGEADCGETVTCQLDCPEGDGMCPLLCMKKADQNAIEGALALLYADSDNDFWAWMFACVGGQGEMDCGELGICLGDCGMMSESEEEPDMKCVMDCLSQSSPDAMDQWLEIFACGDEPCFDKIVSCIGGQGELSCGEALTCMGTCEDGQEGGGDCFTECISQTSEQGMADIMAFLSCAEEKCPEGMEECPGMFECIGLCPGMMGGGGGPGPG